MKRPATTQDYIKYRDEHNGCIDLKRVVYTLSGADGSRKSEGVVFPSDADREQVTKRMYSSVVLACLDSHRREIVQSGNATVGEDRTLKGDAFVLKTKAVVWQVEAIDDSEATVYVRGVM